MKNIFVTVGNDYRSFHRLIEAIDKIGQESKDKFFIQYGYSSYVPKDKKNSRQFLDREEFYKKFQEADLIVAHAGIGNMIDAVTFRKKMIVVPRQSKFVEHINDHQLEIASEVEGKYKNIKILYDLKKLDEEIMKLLDRDVDYPNPPDLKKVGLIREIKEFINE